MKGGCGRVTVMWLCHEFVAMDSRCEKERGESRRLDWDSYKGCDR